METLLTKPEHFTFMKHRWHNRGDDYYNDVDKEIQEFLDIINTHPSISSVMSCAGHDDDRRNPKHVCYIHFAVKDMVGMEFLSRLYVTLSDAVYERWLETSDRGLIDQRVTFRGLGILPPRALRLSHLLMAIPGFPKDDKDPEYTFYRATTLTCGFDKHNIRTELPWYHAQLSSVIKDMEIPHN